jgi:hypothetical protein
MTGSAEFLGSQAAPNPRQVLLRQVHSRLTPDPVQPHCPEAQCSSRVHSQGSAQKR